MDMIDTRLKRDLIKKATNNPSSKPQLLLSHRFEVLSRTVVAIKLLMIYDFVWKDNLSQNDYCSVILVFVENKTTKALIYQDWFVMYGRFCHDVHELNVYVPIPESLSTEYNVHVLSDFWNDCGSSITIAFHEKKFPREMAPPTKLSGDLQPLPLSALNNVEFEEIFQQKGIEFFNLFQTQVFNVCYKSDENVFIGAPNSSGKLTCAELALLRHFEKHPGRNVKAVYVSLNEAVAQRVFKEWEQRIGQKLNKKFVCLTDDAFTNMKLVETGDVIVSTAERWDVISQRWRWFEVVKAVRLLIVDDFHMMGFLSNGYVMEIICTRMQHLLNPQLRTVILSSTLAYADDVCSWLGCTRFNFPLSARPIPAEIRFQSFSKWNTTKRVRSMVEPVYSEIINHSSTKSQSVIVFVPHFPNQVAILVQDRAEEDDIIEQFRHYQADDLVISDMVASIEDETLKMCVESGIGFVQKTLSEHDKDTVETLFKMEAIHILIIPQRLCYHLNVTSYLVIIMDTQLYTNGYCPVNESYPIADLLHMVGIANKRGQRDAKCVIMCPSASLFHLTKFITEPLPFESHLLTHTFQLFTHEIVAGTVTTKQAAFDYLDKMFVGYCISRDPDYSAYLQERRKLLLNAVNDELNFLHDHGFISVSDDMTVTPLKLGRIVAPYHINYMTIDEFTKQLKKDTTVNNLIKIISESSDFKDFSVCYAEQEHLTRLANELGIFIYHNKFYILLHAYFSRKELGDWEIHEEDVENIVVKSMALAQICIGLLTSDGLLVPLLNAMRLCQMLTQAMYLETPCLQQLADFTNSPLDSFENKSVREIKKLLKANSEDRSFLKSADVDMAKVVDFCNHLPTHVVQFTVSADTVELGASVTLKVKVSREYLNNNEKMSTPAPVNAPFYPVKERFDSWWIIVGNPEQNTSYLVERVVIRADDEGSFKFVPTEIGQQKYHLYLVNDSYLGIDEEFTFNIAVLAASTKSEYSFPILS